MSNYLSYFNPALLGQGVILGGERKIRVTPINLREIRSSASPLEMNGNLTLFLSGLMRLAKEEQGQGNVLLALAYSGLAVTLLASCTVSGVAVSSPTPDITSLLTPEGAGTPRVSPTPTPTLTESALITPSLTPTLEPPTPTPLPPTPTLTPTPSPTREPLSCSPWDKYEPVPHFTPSSWFLSTSKYSGYDQLVMGLGPGESPLPFFTAYGVIKKIDYDKGEMVVIFQRSRTNKELMEVTLNFDSNLLTWVHEPSGPVRVDKCMVERMVKEGYGVDFRIKPLSGVTELTDGAKVVSLIKVVFPK